MLLKEALELNVIPFGLFELDDAGTVLFYRPDEQEDMATSALVGRNLLTEVTPIAQAEEFRDRVHRFRRSHTPADSFHFTLCLEETVLQVKCSSHISEDRRRRAQPPPC